VVLDTDSVIKHLDLLRSYLRDLLRYRSALRAEQVQASRDLQFYCQQTHGLRGSVAQSGLLAATEKKAAPAADA
jgi:hypothetical protein